MKQLLIVAAFFLAACSKQESPFVENPGLEIAKAKRNNLVVVDNEAPVVRITSPLTGATADGVMTINVSATDNVGVAKVTLKVNGIPIGVDNSAPYVFTWDASNLSPGTYLITASVRDAAKNITDYSIMLFKYDTTLK